jgi:hypothetical protein
MLTGENSHIWIFLHKKTNRAASTEQNVSFIIYLMDEKIQKEHKGILHTLFVSSCKEKIDSLLIIVPLLE